MREKAIENSLKDFHNVLPRTFWEWLLLFFIVGIMTVSNIAGFSRLMVLYGFLVSWLFLIYFLHLRLKLPPEIIIYFVWIAWCIIGALNVMNFSLYLTQLQTIIQMLVLIFVVAGITALRPNLSVAMLAIAIGGIIVAISSYYTGEFQVGSEIEQAKRATGLIGNANLFSYHLIFILIASFYFWGLKSSLIWRCFVSATIVLSISMTIYSGSRAGYTGVIALSILWFLFCYSKIVLQRPLATLSILFTLAWGLYSTTDFVMSTTLLGKRFEYDHILRSSDHRIQLYSNGLKVIKKNPILGVGLDNNRLYSTGSLAGLYSHSDYIEVAANTGLVGFVLYFSIYVVLWRRLNRIRRMTTHPHLRYIIGLLKASIISILLLANSNPNITSKLTWLFLAAAIGYSYTVERDLLLQKNELDNKSKQMNFEHLKTGHEIKKTIIHSSRS